MPNYVQAFCSLLYTARMRIGISRREMAKRTGILETRIAVLESRGLPGNDRIHVLLTEYGIEETKFIEALTLAREERKSLSIKTYLRKPKSVRAEHDPGLFSGEVLSAKDRHIYHKKYD